MTIEISGNRLTLDNVDPFLILVLLGDKMVDKRVVNEIASPNFSIVVRPSDSPEYTTKKGDYTIVVRKDNGEEVEPFSLILPEEY